MFTGRAVGQSLLLSVVGAGAFLGISSPSTATAAYFTPSVAQLQAMVGSTENGDAGTVAVSNVAGGIQAIVDFTAGGGASLINNTSFGGGAGTDLSAFQGEAYNVQVTAVGGVQTGVGVFPFTKDGSFADTSTFFYIQSGTAPAGLGGNGTVNNGSTFTAFIDFPSPADPRFTPANVFEIGFRFFGTAGAGNTVTMIITPVPEPATMGLLGLALPALGLRRRRA